MMEEKPIKSRHKQLTWKQLKTMETKQEMPVLGKHANVQGVCWREDLLGSGAWHSPTQHFTWCFGSSLSRTGTWEINIFRFRWQHIHACHWHLHLGRLPDPFSTSDPSTFQWWISEDSSRRQCSQAMSLLAVSVQQQFTSVMLLPPLIPRAEIRLKALVIQEQIDKHIAASGVGQAAHHGKMSASADSSFAIVNLYIIDTSLDRKGFLLQRSESWKNCIAKS